MHILVYAPLAAAVLFALLWLARPALNWLAASTAVLRSWLVLLLVAAPLGFAFALLFWHRLCHSAGFAGGVLIPLAGATIVASIALGTWCAVGIGGVDPRPAVLIAVSTVVIAYFIAAHDLLTD